MGGCARSAAQVYRGSGIPVCLLGSCVPLLTTTMRAGRANQSRIPVTKAK
ncbi:Uncharacterised protein [Mycobacterium tuberculosis]|nr:Uncharacterised protein [Mycobacterium tuberculosis]COZ73935.1 Uncharacterised protein [Mycobacterium tuberculosis]